MELRAEEKPIIKRLKRVGKLFAFLRKRRHELFDEPFREELDAMYADAPRGTPPKDPMLMGLVLLLQAYEGASDAVAVENAMFDRRWQLVLDCLGMERPPFSQGAIVDFRRRLIAHDMDRRLLERTVELARTTGDFGHKALRVALDSAPLQGAGRVEDTYNLIAHAMEAVVDCAAMCAGLRPEAVAEQACLALYGDASIKASLDIDWSDDEAKAEALQRILAEVDTLRSWVTAHVPEPMDGDLQRALDLLARPSSKTSSPIPTARGGPAFGRGSPRTASSR
ncbi:MAG: transposase [Myxococcota bacterium]